MTTSIAHALKERGLRQQDLANELGVDKSRVSRWVSNADPIPPQHVLRVEKLTGVSRHDLRPDVFGEAPEAERL